MCVRKLSSKNRVLLRLVRRFWALCDLHSIRVEMDYVRSAENPADAPSRNGARWPHKSLAHRT